VKKLNTLEKFNDNDILREYTLSKIIRYNNRNKLQNESVAEHSFFVTLFCLKIIKNLNLTKDEINRILILSALHDTCESETSDIPHNVKKENPEINKFLEKMEQKYYMEYWKEYYPIIYESTELEHAILKLADTYSVYQYCLNEKDVGNTSKDINEIFIDCEKRLNKWLDIVNKLLEKRPL